MQNAITEGNEATEVILNIIKSTANKVALFEARILRNKKEIKRLISTSSTTVYRNVLSYLNIKVKGQLNGFRFFGFYSSEYKSSLQKLDEIRQNNINDKELESHAAAHLSARNSTDNDSSTNLLIPSHLRESSWGGVVSYGVAIDSPMFTKMIGKIKFQYRAGYEAIRYLKFDKGDNPKAVALHLKIEEKDGKPLFKAFTTEDPIIQLSSNKLSSVLSEIFSAFDILPKRHWSGFEYFGLDKPDVLEVCTKSLQNLACKKLDNIPEEVSAGDSTKQSDQHGEQILTDLKNIRKRNGGETSSLCKKASKARNDKIHKLVEYASFGDIKSEYYFFFSPTLHK